MSKSGKNIPFLLSLLLLLAYISFQLLNRSEPVNSQNQTYIDPPTIFVHGYKGTYNSFNGMLNRFEYNYHWGHRVLICKVAKNGHVFVNGHIPNDSHRMFIQVVFENNRASFQDTSHWLSEVMLLLKERYGIENVNIVGHSMGGIISTKFLLDHGNQLRYPKVEKLVTIGSPFLGIDQSSYFKVNSGPAALDLKPGSKALQDLWRKSNHFPPDVKVLAIAGKGDQVVNISSALSIRRMVPRHNYQDKIVQNVQVTHSGLHESTEVDHFIGTFLWGLTPFTH
ncbi:alpha/beta fold hydrolase [Bacillus smithii]|uniref:alpha/beta fold hydrolase n=1 Tax=Bacillus smithii TaxID=1479 RepID=UPI002E1B8966|nr:alpha/beta fold hydrolase [Bacillus smithii]MED1456541.1 alpha/beta fold hydrolase [Bacillus smithii]